MQKTEWDQLVKEIGYVECEEYQEEREDYTEYQEENPEKELDFN